ncbi:MAG: tRNA guanosine(15) transglycosylase TgtA [Thermoplasmata archaeon]
MFQLVHRDGLARIGELTIGNRKLKTPTILPVIHPFKPEPWLSEIKKLQIDGIITNSYILKKGDYRKDRNLHDYLNFDGIIMTDSGTFQEHMYGDIETGNREMIEFQTDIGSDIVTIRDVFSEIDHSREEVQRGMETTYERGKEASLISQSYLALPVQGGLFPDLRAKSAELMQSIGGEYYPIGGIVPLMERYRYSDVIEIILRSKQGLRSSSVVHAFGAGHPMFFPLLFLAGVDVVDSSAYIKYAREDRIIVDTGTIELKEIAEELPPSPYFDGISLGELKQMKDDERKDIIAKHNLYFTVKEISKVREEIRQENLWNYAEYRSRSHPLLLEAYRRLLTFYDFIEKYESKSKKSPVFYTGPETLERPLIKRFIAKESVSGNFKKEIRKPYSYFLDKPEEAVETPFGNISLFLDETYPVAQSLFPGEYYEKDFDIEKFTRPEWDRYLKLKIDYIFKYQFGKGLFEIIPMENIELLRSKNTGKIRNVLTNGQIILSLRASDGLFSINLNSSRLLHDNFPYPSHRVVIDGEVTEFVKEGRNVFSKFIRDADDGIRPGDEVIIVDENDILIAYGRTLMNKKEMLEFKQGMSIKNRIKSKE